MFPESFAEKWIDRLTRRDEVVLDPFCGRGTVPFQAMLMERIPVGNDINPVAFCVTRAKTNAPQVSRLMRRLQSLEAAFNSSEWETQRRKLPEVFRHAYRANTARQLLYLKTSLRWRTNTADCMIAALCLGALHGEMDASHRYLSNQMPRTISTKPSYSIKFWKERGLVPPKRDVFKVLRKAAIFRYESGIAGRTKGQILNHDIRELPMLSRKFARPVRCVITSPPYYNITDFGEDQWLRLWFLGAPPYPTRGRVSRDDRYSNVNHYWSFMADTWRALGQILARRSNIVIRFGARHLDPEQMVTLLEESARFTNRRVELVNYEVSKLIKRQTNAFRPGSSGCRVEVDCHFALR